MDNSQGNRSEQSPALEIKQCVCAVCSNYVITGGKSTNSGRWIWETPKHEPSRARDLAENPAPVRHDLGDNHGKRNATRDGSVI